MNHGWVEHQRCGSAGDPACLCDYFEKSWLSSANEAALANSANDPVSLMVRAARMKASQATRASPDPTETLRTPRSVKWPNERSRLGPNDSTLTGLGETALTIAETSSGWLTPGA